MEWVTDIPKIEQLATKRSEANWRFRCFLKGLDMESEALDAIVHRLYETVSAQIDCQTCGHCCRVLSPSLEKRDIDRLSIRLSVSPEAFEKEYLVKDEEKQRLLFRSTPCPFLSDNSCSVYADRPNVCRSYPHLLNKDFVGKLHRVLSNLSVCPIVYNVYELLKAELHTMGVDSLFEEYEYDGSRTK